MAQVTKAEQTHANHFVLFARDFIIAWGSDQRYWKWTYEQQASNAFVEVAELLKVCWFDVKVKLNTKSLTPGIYYYVSFIVKLTDKADGWELPVNVKLVLPDKHTITNKVDFKTKPRNEWIPISVGEFMLGHELHGDIEISMFETSDDHWKKGLLLDSVNIQTVLYSGNTQPVQ